MQRTLPYRKPTEGRDYWIFDDVLPAPDTVRARCLNKPDWALGAPYTSETWPGRRAIPALEADELAVIEGKVRQATGASKLWVQATPDGKTLNHNCVQVVGAKESASKPHTDSRALCRFAGVLYLAPNAPEHCGTSFYRQRMPTGQLGGNVVTGKHNSLVDALGTRFVPPDSFIEDVRVTNRFNRLLVYHAALIHSATAYFGSILEDSRMSAVFFWMGG